MRTQFTLSSLSSSAYSCYRYPHHLHVVPRIAAKSSVAKRKLVFSQAPKHGFSNSKLEVVNDGMDCLPNPKTPWLKLCPELDTKEGVIMDSFYSIAEDRVVRLNRKDCLGVPATAMCFASTGEWLGFINPIYDLKIYLANPFFSDKDMGVICLPSLTSIPACVGVECDPETGCVNMMFDDMDESIPSDVFANDITNLAISHLDPRHVDCIVTALQGPDMRRLAYSRIWDDHDHKTSLRWIGLQEDSPPINLDNQVVFSHTHKLFYTVNSNGIEAFDLFSDGGKKKKKGSSKRKCVFSHKKINKELRNEFDQEHNKELKDLRESTTDGGSDPILIFHRLYHLVMLDDPGESSQLLLIVRHLVQGDAIGKTLHFDVFKVVFHGRRLVRLKTLGDYCLFVGGSNSFSLRASGVPGLHPNSIYFVRHHFFREFGVFDFDRGIFNLDNNEIEPITCTYCPASPLHQDVFSNEMWKGCEEVLWVSPSNIIA